MDVKSISIMGYDTQLSERLDKLVAEHPNIEPRKMFGGMGFMLYGNMCFGVHKNSLVLRLGEKQAEKLMEEPHVNPMDITGKVMKGWAMVGREWRSDNRKLKRYINLAIKFVSTLPVK